MQKIKRFFILLFLFVVITLFYHVFEARRSFDTLAMINSYQAQYFEIIKRNEMLFSANKDDVVVKDLEDLSALYNKVISHIDPNCVFLAKYNEIEQKYAQKGVMSAKDMVRTSGAHFRDVDRLYIKTIETVSKVIAEEDFNKLVRSDRAWRDEVETFNKVYYKQGLDYSKEFIYNNYQTDVIKFRALLLMLYL